MIYMRIDQVMIKIMLDSDSVGNYAAAVKLSEALYFIPVAIGQSIFPAILSARDRGLNIYHKRLKEFYSMMIWIGILIALPVTFLSGIIINILYGSEYIMAGDVLAIHIWAAVFVFMGVASAKYLLAENLQKYTFFMRFFGCIINVVMNLILIPKYGIKGAAFSTVFSQCVASYLGYLISPKTYINFKLLTYSFILPFIKLKNIIKPNMEQK